jgi:superfamily II DNA helicase RecQ
MCIEASVSGFEVKNYLTVRAKSLLIKAAKKPKAEKAEQLVEEVGIKYPKLFSQLKAWRSHLADELNIPVYFVMAQKTIG